MKKILYTFSGGMLGFVIATIACVVLFLVLRLLGFSEANSIVSFLVVSIFICSWLGGSIWALFRYWARYGYPPALRSYLENRS